MKHALQLVFCFFVGGTAVTGEALNLDIKAARSMFKMSELNQGFFDSELAISRMFRETVSNWSAEQIELDNGKKVKLSGNWTARLIMGYCEDLGLHEKGVCIASAIQKPTETKNSFGKTEDDDGPLVGVLLLTQPSCKPPSPDNDAIAREQAWRTLKKIAELISEDKPGAP